MECLANSLHIFINGLTAKAINLLLYRKLKNHECSSSSNLLHFTEYGSGPTLLLIHGLMITGEMFEPAIAHLSANHRLIIPDLRGHGRSRGLPPPYTSVQLAADLAYLLEHLNIVSAAVLGYSQGGTIAQQLALDYPKRCNQLILACTYAYNMGTFRERFEGKLLPLFIRLLGMKLFSKLIISLGLKNVSKERAEWVTGLIAGQDTRLMVLAWKEAMAFDSRKRLEEIKCPTLVIAASKDDAIPVYHSKMLHTGIRDSQFVIIDGADHALIWTHTDELTRLMCEFLRNSVEGSETGADGYIS
jgi:3-oxoadipate enol-lactonase